MPPPRIRHALLSRLRAANSLKYLPPHRQSAAAPKGSLIRQLKWVAGIYVFGHIFMSYIGGISPTSGVSMVPTIPDGGVRQPWIIYSRWYRRGRNIKVGDVITLTPPNKPREAACKRVIGMPGDYVSVVSLGRKDEDLEKKADEGDWANVKSEMFRVPEGHCWVQGDNLEWSTDSRTYGPVPLALVQSKALCWFSLGKLRWLNNGLEDVKEGEKDWVVM